MGELVKLRTFKRNSNKRERELPNLRLDYFPRVRAWKEESWVDSRGKTLSDSADMDCACWEGKRRGFDRNSE